MSSSAIMSQIHACEGQITRKGQEITKLLDKIEKQETAISVYGQKIADLFSEIDDKSSRISAVVAYDPEAVTSVRFDEASNASFETQKGAVRENAEAMEHGMRTELTKTNNELETAEMEMASLKSRLSGLWSDYYAAVAREEADAAAQAAANQ